MVDLPKNSKAINCRWVFHKKDNEQYKTMLVVKGYAQNEDIDHNEIFSPVVKNTSIRMLVIVPQFDLELEQLDVKTTFMHGELEERIYMKQPEGYIQEGQETRVYLLNKSLYELNQSPRQLYKRLDSFMIKVRYNRSEYDRCVYFKQNDDLTYLLLYADDMLIGAKNKTYLET